MTPPTKVAVIREAGYPVGQAAPCYLNCPCGYRPTVPLYDVAVHCACGRVYDAAGYVVNTNLEG